jgi:transporter family protein
MTEARGPGKFPPWLFWSLATILLWGVWGLVSKVASAGVDPWVNQLLYTCGVLPLLVIFFVRTRGKSQQKPTAGGHDAARVAETRNRRAGAAWAFATGILGGLGNIAFFQALVKDGKASVVTPVTALFPMVTVLLALVVFKERLRAVQWAGLGLAFVAIYLLSA